MQSRVYAVTLHHLLLVIVLCLNFNVKRAIRNYTEQINERWYVRTTAWKTQA